MEQIPNSIGSSRGEKRRFKSRFEDKQLLVLPPPKEEEKLEKSWRSLQVLSTGDRDMRLITSLERAGEGDLADKIALADIRYDVDVAVDFAEKFLKEIQEAGGDVYGPVDNIMRFLHEYHRLIRAFEILYDNSAAVKLARFTLCLYDASVEGGVSGRRGQLAEIAGANDEEMAKRIDLKSIGDVEIDSIEGTRDQIIPALITGCSKFLEEIKDDPIWNVDEIAVREEVRRELKERLGLSNVGDGDLIEQKGWQKRDSEGSYQLPE